MVMSVLGMALSAGADYEAAIRLANVAGGLEVEKIGVAMKRIVNPHPAVFDSHPLPKGEGIKKARPPMRGGRAQGSSLTGDL